MPLKIPDKVKVFIDADVLVAGIASPSEHSTSQVILRLAEITLIEAMTSHQVICEVERNLQDKLPKAIPVFQLLVQRCLQIVADPDPENLKINEGFANPKDLPILVAALMSSCKWLVTFNLRHYSPGHPQIQVAETGNFIRHIRQQLSNL